MLEINAKKDILTPFETIGDANWEENTRTIIESVADVWGDDLKEPISETTILELEKKLNTTLPKTLKTFYMTFGLADISEQLLAFNEIDWIKNIWAKEPQYGPDFTEEDKKILPFLISFSDGSGNGNMFCFHSETKEIYYFDHESIPYLTKFFNTFDDYLKGSLIFAQNDLFGEEVEQERVEKWTEKIVTDLFGKSIVRQWKY